MPPPDWYSEVPLDPEAETLLDRLISSLKWGYFKGDLTIERLRAALLALEHERPGQSYLRASLVAAVEQARVTGHHFHLRIALDELLALGAIVKLPPDELVAEWLGDSRLGALLIAARIAVACGWDGARSEAEEKERFKAAWQRERGAFTSSDTN